MPKTKVAIVHDWLVLEGGAEKVLREMLALFPEADLFSTVDFLEEKDRGFLGGRTARTSFIQSLPFARKHYRKYLPLMPLAIEQLDMAGYDLIISSSYAVAKGVITGPDQVHVAYVHSPARYAWDLQSQYLRESRLDTGVKGMLARWMLHKFRIWDVRTAHGVDLWLCNSAFVGRRIRKVYGKDAEVIHPPVGTDRFTPVDDKDDFYLTASRMVPYKRIPLIAEAFARMPDQRLVIIGDGPEMDAVRRKAGPNVTLMGYQPDRVLIDHMQRARAFVFAAEEDFGIVPLEAQACATPVIAYGRGGALETVLPGKTGLFFDEQTPGAIAEAVRRFEAEGVSGTVEDFRAHVDGFSAAAFRAKFAAVIARACTTHPALQAGTAHVA